MSLAFQAIRSKQGHGQRTKNSDSQLRDAGSYAGCGITNRRSRKLAQQRLVRPGQAAKDIDYLSRSAKRSYAKRRSLEQMDLSPCRIDGSVLVDTGQGQTRQFCVLQAITCKPYHSQAIRADHKSDRTTCSLVAAPKLSCSAYFTLSIYTRIWSSLLTGAANLTSGKFSKCLLPQIILYLSSLERDGSLRLLVPLVSATK